MKLTGAEILIECLKEQSVDTIFGYPGGAVLNIYDALYKHSKEIKHYLTSHEQGAAHAADGYARASGKVGVCMATSGPGATNLVTGIATAYMDSIPMVAITGNVALPLLGKDSFQEVDIAGITIPITKHNYIVKDVAHLADTIREAFYIAREGRPGPVLIDITKDVTANECEYEYKEPLKIRPITKTIRKQDINEAVELINESKKPLIYCGGGVIISEASEEVKELVRLIDSPVCVSAMGLGAFPASDKHFTGMIGMHGTKTSNLASSECDLLIAIGARFSDRVVSDAKKFASNAKVLHIDVDSAEINKNIVSSASVVGDVKEVLRRLNPLLEQRENREWMAYIHEMQEKYPVAYNDDGNLKPQYILERINHFTKSQAIITTEVGQHQMWSCHYLKYENPRSFLSSGGLGTMGYGLGACIGAKIACPDKPVFNIAGDGCFRMNNIELATASEYNLPIIVVVMNNHTLGMVRQWQSMFYDKRYSQTTLNRPLDVCKLAEAYNALSFNVTKKDDVDAAIEKALAANCPVVINCEIDRDEKVFPMVPPGAGIDELVSHPLEQVRA